MDNFLQIKTVHIREQEGSREVMANTYPNNHQEVIDFDSVVNPPLNIALPGVAKQNEMRAKSFIVPRLANELFVMTKTQANFLCTNQNLHHAEQLVLQEVDPHSNLTFALRPIHWQDLFQLVDQNKESVDLRLQLDATLEEKNSSQQQNQFLQSELFQARKELVELKESSDSYRKRTAENLACYYKERFDLECSLRQLQVVVNKDKGIEQMQIDSLQLALTEAHRKYQDRERELETTLMKKINSRDEKIGELTCNIKELQMNQSLLTQALEEKQALLNKVRAEYAKREADLQAALDESNQSSRQDISRIKAEFAQQIHSLLDQRETLQEELASLQESSNEVEAEHKKTITSLSVELDQAREYINDFDSIRQNLNDQLREEQEASLAKHEQLTQAIEEQKKEAKEEQSHLKSLIKDLTVQLDMRRSKVHQYAKRLKRMKSMLINNSRVAKRLHNLVKSKDEDLIILKQCLANEELDHQQLNSELQEMVRDNQLAWEKVSETDLKAQMARQELTAIKSELTQENATLRAELEHSIESSELAQGWHYEEMEKLSNSLEKYKSAHKAAENTIRILKSDQKPLREAKLEFDRQEKQLTEEYRLRISELKDVIKSDRKEIMALRNKLTAGSDNKASTAELKNLRLALLKSQGENAFLKEKLAGLDQVKTSAGKQFGKDKQINIKRSLDGVALPGKRSAIKRSRNYVIAISPKRHKASQIKTRSKRTQFKNRNANDEYKSRIMKK